MGLLIGAAAGALVAILTTPKPGREMRDELAGRARDAADKAREAAGASDWAPLFQRPEGNGAAEALPDGEPSPAVDTTPSAEPEQPS